MELNKEISEAISEFKSISDEFKFDFAVGGSASLFMHGMTVKHPHDLDIVVETSDEVWNAFKLASRVAKSTRFKRYTGGIDKVGLKIKTKFTIVDVDIFRGKLDSRCMTFNGIKYLPIDYVLKHKLGYGRPKDVEFVGKAIAWLSKMLSYNRK
jgi:hypothetical protein